MFRFEYYYVLKGQTIGGTSYPSILSDTPWDARSMPPATVHSGVSGLRDVAAIAMTVAVIDPKSRALVSDAQLTTLAAQMKDFAVTMQPGDLEAQWQGALDASTIPRATASAIRVYNRYFYLNASAQ